MKTIKYPHKLFVTGTGTDVGKSYATGWLSRTILENGETCITQKLIQTGNIGYSEDIILHRKIMGSGLLQEDMEFISCPVIFSYPASPDLASRIDGKKIDFKIIEESTEILASRFDHVLIEGAGGLMVPIEGEFLMADYVKKYDLPLFLVVSGQLGSINHALLSLNAVQSYGIDLFAVIYNPYFDKDPVIVPDTREYLKNWLHIHFPSALWLDMPDKL